MDFIKFPKIARISRDCVITEKIDGTNAQIFIVDETEVASDLSGKFAGMDDKLIVKINNSYIFAGSRNRFLIPTKDNKGFAKWVLENAEDLSTLGGGNHYGEWWGQGIQRNYGLKEKRFSLFNVHRWDNSTRPKCCGVVPTLYNGIFDTENVDKILGLLKHSGSLAEPGFMKPEGIVIFHTHGSYLFKKTIENDSVPKSEVK